MKKKKEESILVAVSGGVDSVVLLHYLLKQGFSLAVAHCNFSLRGKESDGDASFVKELCEHYRIPFFSKKFNTKKEAKEKGISIQMAARNLRYEWFYALASQHSFTKIAVAHHADDRFETVLINLSRGTGIAGLTALSADKGNLFRPLLSWSRKEIEAYAKKNKLQWREDSSNIEDKYARNKIRHKVVPVLKELNPSLLQTFAHSQQRFKNVQLVYQKAKGDFLVKAAFEGGWKFKITQDKFELALLSEILFDFGFTHDAISKILKSEKSESGRIFTAKNCRLIRDRKEWILAPVVQESGEYFLKKNESITTPLVIECSSVQASKHKILKDVRMAQLDEAKLKFPLILRKWKKGDWFIPFGMKGKVKLSDFFINHKFSLFEKENTWILESDGEVVWVVAKRVDARYAVGETTKKVYLAQAK